MNRARKGNHDYEKDRPTSSQVNLVYFPVAMIRKEKEPVREGKGRRSEYVKQKERKCLLIRVVSCDQHDEWWSNNPSSPLFFNLVNGECGRGGGGSAIPKLIWQA